MAFRGTTRFAVLSTLGAGGAGVVYEAIDRETDRRIALKTLKTRNPETLRLLKNEFRSVADVHHPNLVRLGELLEDNGLWFFTMELVDGVDVLSYVRPRRGSMPPRSVRDGNRDIPSGPLPPLDEARLRSAFAQMVLGLQALHHTGKVHCDVKPSNVLVTREGRVVVLDFGIVRDHDDAEENDGELRGTAAYMAPEQALGEDVGPPSDLYALGVVLYVALAGELPFEGGLHAVAAKLAGPPRDPREIAPEAPPDLAELCLELLQPAPEDRPTAEEVLARLGVFPAAKDAPATPTPVFVGRSDEITVLTRAFEEARRGHAVTVVLEGESGVGKSCLAQEFVARAFQGDPRLVVLDSRCYERETVPYKALDGVVDALTDRLARLPDETVERLLPPDVASLRAVFPAIERIDAVARAEVPAPPNSPFEQRKRVATTLRAWLTLVARELPVIVLIDDLQWANPDSLLLLADVMRPPAAPPLLLLVTQRPTGSTRRALEGDVRWLEVGNLPASDASSLVHALLAVNGSSPSERQIERITHETEGHPLFIHELIRRGSRTSLAAASVRLDDVLWTRILRLDARARSVLELVCLGGVPLLQELVASALGVPFGELTELLGTLRSGNFVRTSGLRRDDVVEPYHDRVREAVVAHLAPADRKRIHRLLAETLTTRGAAPAELRAVHWAGAGDGERAFSTTLEAADAAATALAFDHAADLYRRALAAAGSSLGDALAVSVYRRLGDALRNAGRGPEAAAAYQTAASRAVRDAALELQRRAADQLLTSGHFDDGRAAMRRVLEAERLRIAWNPLLAIVWGLLRRAFLSLRGLKFTPRTESEVDPRCLHEMDLLWDVLRGLALIEASLLYDLTARLLILALRAGEPSRIANYLSTEAMSQGAWGTRGSLARARTLSRAAAEILPPDANKHTLGLQKASEAFTTFYHGHWREAVELYLEAELLFREHGAGVAWETGVTSQFCLIALFRSGQIRRLRTAANAILRDATRRGDLFAMTGAAVGYPNLTHVLDDDVQRARVESADVLRRWSREVYLYQHYLAWMAEMHADLYEGDAKAACHRARETWPSLARSFLLTFPEIAHEAWHLRGRAAMALAEQKRGSDDERWGLRAAARDAQRLRRRTLPWPRANAALLEASIAHHEGRLDAAKSALLRALALYLEADMPLYVAVVRRRLASLLGGDEGKALAAEAGAFFVQEKVARPDRVAAMIAPGFGRL